jgi:hypothetical protein
MRWWCCFRRAAHITEAVRSRAVLQVSWPPGEVFIAVNAIVQAPRLAVNIKTGFKMKIWTKSEMDLLKQVYPISSSNELINIFGRNRQSIASKACELGLKKPHITHWTSALDKYVREHYGTRTTTQMADDLGTTRSALKNRVHKLGIFLPEDVKNERRKSALGKIAHNAGEKMSADKYGKCSATFFKKGKLPHNTRHDGAISVRKDKSGWAYKHIRIQKAKWVLLHRKVWEDANGAIPYGHIIGFKDGDSMNCDIDNLYCMSKADNMIRNSAVVNLPDGYVARNIVGRKAPKADVDIILKHLPEAVALQRAQILFNREIKKQNETAKR